MWTTRIAAVLLTICATMGLARAQDPEVLYRDAFYALEEQRPNAAIPLLREAADFGHIAAQRTLGLILIYGESLFGQALASEFEEGLMWLRKAAAQGDPAARIVAAHFDHAYAAARP